MANHAARGLRCIAPMAIRAAWPLCIVGGVHPRLRELLERARELLPERSFVRPELLRHGPLALFVAQDPVRQHLQPAAPLPPRQPTTRARPFDKLPLLAGVGEAVRAVAEYE